MDERAEGVCVHAGRDIMVSERVDCALWLLLPLTSFSSFIFFLAALFIFIFCRSIIFASSIFLRLSVPRSFAPLCPAAIDRLSESWPLSLIFLLGGVFCHAS